jgi:cyclase
LLTELAAQFGSQCIVLALDAARVGGLTTAWEVVVRSGRERTGIDALAWAREGEQRGAGEILLTSWDRDGTHSGYELELVRAVCAAVSVPLIASGGASSAVHMLEGLRAGATGVLVASILHDGHTTVGALKRELSATGLEVRP